MAWNFKIVDVFTDRPLAGNQLAVVLDVTDRRPRVGGSAVTVASGWLQLPG